MIITVTLNPVLVVRYDGCDLELAAANQVSRGRHQAGGRGLAVARLLQRFGHEVLAAGLAGGSSGELIRADLARAGVPTQFTRIGSQSRRSIRIADAATGQITTLAEPAPYITTEELGRLASDYRSMLDGATAVVLCGSLPAGLPAETYGSLTRYATEAGVPVVVSAGGSALLHAAARRPALAIPDLPLRGEGQGADLLSVGAQAVVITAADGARVVTSAGEWRAVVEPASAPDDLSSEYDGLVAARRRDALVAGLVPGVALAWSWPDMLRHAVALAASVTRDGDVDLTAYERRLGGVAVTAPAGTRG